MSLRAKSITQSADGQRSLVVTSSVRWKRTQSTRSAYTKGIVTLRLAGENSEAESLPSKATKDAA